jgi:dTDP-4-dehydrorhamnose 3,5-epimerase-like enzyme
VPPGFAHGNFFEADSRIEYYCTGEYSPGCEAGVSPLAGDIDWSLADPALKARFDAIIGGPVLMSEKDRHAPDMALWLADPRSDHFRYSD